MKSAICYLFGGDAMPSLHGTVALRAVRDGVQGVDIDLEGLDDRLYGIRIGETELPPVAADGSGRIHATFYRRDLPEPAGFGGQISVFRYARGTEGPDGKRSRVACGTARCALDGRKGY